MKNALLAIMAIAAMATTAVAADLPNRQNTPELPETYLAPSGSWFASTNFGYLPEDGVSLTDGQSTIGAALGYEYNEYFRTEVAFNHFFESGGYDSGQTVVVNGVGQLPIPGTMVVPYVFAGVGAGFNGLGDDNGDTRSIYDWGIGSRIAVTDEIDLDARWTRFSGWEDDRDTDAVTVGLSIRF